MPEFKPGDKVRTPVGRLGTISRLESKWGQEGAHLNVPNDFGEPSRYTSWYPLRSLSKVETDG